MTSPSPEALAAELKALRARVRELEAGAAELARLRESERLLRLVLDTIPLRVFWKDRDYRYLGCNQVFARDTGLSPAQVVGRHDFELPWRSIAHLYRADDVAVVEEGRERHAYEEPLVLEGQPPRWVETTKVPLRDEQGQVIGVFGCYDDVTARKRTLDALRESEARYRSVVESAFDGIFVVDTDGRFLSANPAGLAYLGYTEDELRALTIRDVVDPQDRPAQARDLAALREGRAVLGERRLLRKDGGRVEIEISARRLPNGHVVGVMRDMTERRRAEAERGRLEEELRHAQRLETVGRLAGGVAHDFNNLLTVVLNCAHIARRAVAEGGRPQAELQHIVDAAARAAELTGQLLAFSRKQVLRPERLDLGVVLRAALPMLRSAVGEAVSVHLELAPDLPPIEADRGQLEQVVLNLAVNARDAMPGGGELALCARGVTDDDGARWAELTVRDSGEGMDEETRARVFEPFFTTKAPGVGTGLGLATVYGTVTQSGGTIEVSCPRGGGTTFTLRFPAAKERTPGLAPSPGQEPATVGRRAASVLLVEDQEVVRGVLQRVLEGAGHRVIVAASAEEALERLETVTPPDLLVTDVVLPGMSGPALADRLLAARPTLCVLLVSGYTHRYLEDGAPLGPRTRILQKPFEPDALLAEVQRLLDGP